MTVAEASVAIRARTRLSIGVLIETIVRLLLRAHETRQRSLEWEDGRGQGIRQRGPLFVLAITGDREIDRRIESTAFCVSFFVQISIYSSLSSGAFTAVSSALFCFFSHTEHPRGV